MNWHVVWHTFSGLTMALICLVAFFGGLIGGVMWLDRRFGCPWAELFLALWMLLGVSLISGISL